MITGLQGTLTGAGSDWVDVTVGGVTLRASVPAPTADYLGSQGGEVKLLTSLQVRDDALTLYGFVSEDARAAFQALIGVNGVGPRVALSILSGLTPEELSVAIANGDATAFKIAQGVGTKTANRIVLELKGKLDFEAGGAAVPPGNQEVVDALTALGYSFPEAGRAVAQLSTDGDLSLEEKIRLALEQIGGD